MKACILLLLPFLFCCHTGRVSGEQQQKRIPADIVYTDSLSEVTVTLSRHDAVVWIADWLWTHSSSTLDSNNGDPVINTLHDMLPDVKAEEGEYERFVHACLQHAFQGQLSDTGYSSCENELWLRFNLHIDYEPWRELETIIELAQPLTERHWPWKTHLGISRVWGKDGREYGYICQGYGCDKKYVFLVEPCGQPLNKPSSSVFDTAIPLPSGESISLGQLFAYLYSEEKPEAPALQ